MVKKQDFEQWENDYIILATPTWGPKAVGKRLKRTGESITRKYSVLTKKVKKTTFLPKWYYNRLPKEARKRKLEFEVSHEYLENMLFNQKFKCALSGLPISIYVYCGTTETCREKTTASLDRKDSSLGYIYGNVQWVHKNINMAKGSMPDEDFIFFCNSVTKHNAKSNNKRLESV